MENPEETAEMWVCCWISWSKTASCMVFSPPLQSTTHCRICFSSFCQSQRNDWARCQSSVLLACIHTWNSSGGSFSLQQALQWGGDRCARAREGWRWPRDTEPHGQPAVLSVSLGTYPVLLSHSKSLCLIFILGLNTKGTNTNMYYAKLPQYLQASKQI